MFDTLLEGGYKWNEIYEMDILGFLKHFVEKEEIEEKEITKTSLISAFTK